MQTQDPNQTKNVILAVLLSMGVLLTWQLFYAGPKMQAEQERQRRLAETSASQTVTPPGQVGAPSAPGAPALAPGAAPRVPAIVSVDRATALKSTKRVAIETPSVIGSINLKGASVDDITLVKYHEAPDPKSPRVVVFSPVNAPQPYFAEFKWVAPAGSTAKLPDETTEWTAPSGAVLVPGKPVTLTYDNGEGLKFARTFAIDENYMVTVSDTVENAGTGEVTLYPYAAINRIGTPKIEGFFIQHEGLIGVLGATGHTEVTYADLREEGGNKKFENVTGGWIGFTDKYWAAALIPDQKAPYNAGMRSANAQSTIASQVAYHAEYVAGARAVPAGGKAQIDNRLYVGAKNVNIIEAYQEKLGITQFELMIDWGWFYFITKPLYYLLNWLYEQLGNFGYAILAVTVIVKALFFYFANKSYESMAKMKKMQPEMQKLQERYKDDKAEQQKQLMALYQKEKINPLAGCLPVLIQIPVFFALYKVLFVSIEMRHAPFVGWIQDLSAPDPTTIFNLFGLLPYTVPAWIPAVGVWPLLMGITMWLQMQLNPKQPDPTQQMIFNWMPVLFTFLLASFPAGLVIYWAWNNVLSLFQQYFIMRRQGVDVHLFDNIRKTAGAAKEAAGVAKKAAGSLRKRDGK